MIYKYSKIVMQIITAVNLSKVYQLTKTLNKVNLAINSNEIIALLGPNGAGKTTLLSIIAGLVKPSYGNIEWKVFENSNENANRRFGFMPEMPQFFEYLSGYQNLKIFSTIYTKCNLSEISESLKYVGLEKQIHKKVRKYSHGMRQRLALARALLGDPPLLLLDEPTNGLDPEGIIEFRDILNSLIQDKKKIILLASHALTEVEKTCSRIIILRQGNVIFDGDKKELVGNEFCIIKTSDNQKAIQILKDRNPEQTEKLIKVNISEESIPEIVSILSSNNISVYEIKQSRKTLEQAYMEKVNAYDSEKSNT